MASIGLKMVNVNNSRKDPFFVRKEKYAQVIDGVVNKWNRNHQSHSSASKNSYLLSVVNNFAYVDERVK